MQTATPEAMDFEQESERTREMYGLNGYESATFGRQCLLARRLIERGVRFVQIFFSCTRTMTTALSARTVGWRMTTCNAITPPVPPAWINRYQRLLADLKARGLLDSTLVIWGGEFGRTADSQDGGRGRDHNPHANTIWMTGGGIRGGAHYGTTDEFGYKAVDHPVSATTHATILHLFGIDHTRLTYRFNGRDFRLTDVAGNVIREILS